MWVLECPLQQQNWVTKVFFIINLNIDISNQAIRDKSADELIELVSTSIRKSKMSYDM